jgi:hypothetical protein
MGVAPSHQRQLHDLAGELVALEQKLSSLHESTLYLLILISVFNAHLI